jgi:hypothetical protein
MAATAHTVTSASVGTALVTGAGTIESITITAPAAGTLNSNGINDAFVLLDTTATQSVPVAGPPAKILYSATLSTLLFIFGIKPNIPLTPGLTAPASPFSLGNITIPFANGLFVQACPANLTFTVTA